ncbi:MAG: hypothetical protein KGD58_00305 [Candidatus Lokiarchaeota archaeon]|nr:hypothetical protein [Candidatus Lokiarchaeota archaeon]
MINSDDKCQEFNLEGNFPKANGLIGFLVLDKTGLLYFSKVAKNQLRIEKNIFQIAGFISAILIYSQDLIGSEDSGIKLEDVNLGNHHLYVCSRGKVIFAYFVEKHRISDNFKSCVQIVIEKFIDTYYNSHIKNFKGEVSPFHCFDRIINQYFEI